MSIRNLKIDALGAAAFALFVLWLLAPALV